MWSYEVLQNVNMAWKKDGEQKAQIVLVIVPRLSWSWESLIGWFRLVFWFSHLLLLRLTKL